jgi:hypothetical protein
MDSVIFGNPNTDWWKLSFDDVSRREQIIAVDGELQVGFFTASTLMCIPPAVLEQFASVVELLYNTLTGSATLRNANRQSEVSWTLTANALGHIRCGGFYSINRNTLNFSFLTDQTELPGLLAWLRRSLATYNARSDL